MCNQCAGVGFFTFFAAATPNELFLFYRTINNLGELNHAGIVFFPRYCVFVACVRQSVVFPL